MVSKVPLIVQLTYIQHRYHTPQYRHIDVGETSWRWPLVLYERSALQIKTISLVIRTQHNKTHKGFPEGRQGIWRIDR